MISLNVFRSGIIKKKLKRKSSAFCQQLKKKFLSLMLIRISFLPFTDSADAELVHGEYFAVKDERDSTIEHFIQFSMSLRGKPAILGELLELLSLKALLTRTSH